MNPPEINNVKNWTDYYRNNITYKDWYAKIDGILPLFSQIVSKQSEILDIGCGTSRLCEQLNALGYKNVTAIDFNEEVIKFQQKHNNITQFFTEDARKTSFPNELFDIIIVKASFDFMMEDITEVIQILNEMWRLMKVNSCLMILSQLPENILEKILKTIVWNALYSTQIRVDSGCINHVQCEGAANVFLCFK